MSAHLYYDRDSPVLSDADFDTLCFDVYEGWDELDAFRQWQLGDDAEAILATACHVRITQAVIDGAESWHEAETGSRPEKPYRFKKKGTHEGCPYVGVSG